MVESYVETGEPVGSRALTRKLTETLSPATIRNIMADLQDLGLLYAPHTSAGRLPTDAGLKLFVNGLLEVGNLSEEERESIEARCAAVGRSVTEALEQATTLLSGLSRCAGLVMAPKTEQPLKHIEFVNLGPGRALVVTVTQSGHVENRVIDTPIGMPASALVEATNYLNARLIGRTFEDARRLILEDLKLKRAELNDLTARVIESGLATWAGEPGSALIVRGQARLLEDITAIEDLERVRTLFDALGARREFRAPARTRQRRLGRADLHRRRQSAVRQHRLLDGGGAVPRFAGTHPGRHRRHRPDAAQLRPHHPAGRLHRPHDRPRGRLALDLFPERASATLRTRHQSFSSKSSSSFMSCSSPVAGADRRPGSTAR